LLQGFLVGGREPRQLSGHEIHHVVGVALNADAIDVPLPSPCGGVEPEEPLVGQRDEKLDREERVSAGLLVHQLRQGPHALQLAMQGIGDESADIVEPERHQHNLLNLCSSFTNRLEGSQKRVR
jgi:hypothetical protein